MKDDDIYYGEPDVLRETPVILQPDEACSILPKDQNILICSANSAHGPTVGDEGGPLMLVRQDKFILYGLASNYINFPFEGDLLAVSNSGNIFQQLQ